ncbi:hypothetical protein D9M68_701210 [compost metagenome]
MKENSFVSAVASDSCGLGFIVIRFQGIGKLHPELATLIKEISIIIGVLPGIIRNGCIGCVPSDIIILGNNIQHRFIILL